jgi:hypothetical protein
MMTDEQRAAIRDMIQRQSAISAASPEAAWASLLRSGLYTADGELREKYGGPKRKTPPAVKLRAPRHRRTGRP